MQFPKAVRQFTVHQSCLHAEKSCAVNLKILLNHKKGKFTFLIVKKSHEREKEKERKIWSL